MNRKLLYRRILMLVLAVTLVCGVYYVDKHPVFNSAVPAADAVSENTEKSGDTGLVKQVKEAVSTSTDEEVLIYPCGFQIGIYLETTGVMIIGTDDVEGADGVNYNPGLNKVKAGDYITKINDIDVSSKNQLMFLVNKYGGEDVVLTIIRNGKTITTKITPVQTGENEYKLGIWVRDDTQGIGTMTYLKSDGSYATLGHGITDIDTGELLDSDGGMLYQANVWGIKRGEAGNPGALYGMISYENDNILGSIESNTDIGVYGTITEQSTLQSLIEEYELEPVEVAEKNEIQKGTAYLRSCVSGEVCDYEVEIEKINSDSGKNRGIVLKVTDERLLNLTNGIVQGMSGTPIIQNGKLVGAVTHVFVNDSTRGYGIFIEEMLGDD